MTAPPSRAKLQGRRIIDNRGESLEPEFSPCTLFQCRKSICVLQTIKRRGQNRSGLRSGSWLPLSFRTDVPGHRSRRMTWNHRRRRQLNAANRVCGSPKLWGFDVASKTEDGQRALYLFPVRSHRITLCCSRALRPTTDRQHGEPPTPPPFLRWTPSTWLCEL
jgi:hypothetical protein